MILRTMALALVTAAAGCTQAYPTAMPCRNIPANGCPLLANGSECSDRACAAAYACTDGAWTFERSCPGFDGGRADGAAPVPPDAGETGSGCSDAAGVDAPQGASGGQGCNELISPDCPLSRALFCRAASADPCNGCDSFFVCQGGAWIPWGGCSPDGSVSLRK